MALKPLSNDDVIVIGHKNPDTDSICSAISYAYLKNQLQDGRHYIACRAGDIGEETAYVLSRFGVKPPVFMNDVTKRVFDVDFDRTEWIDRTASLREAWMSMRRQKVSTLPVVRHGRLEGVITMEDIALSYMETINNRMISEAHTKFCSMADTIGGKVVVGNPEGYYTSGKILIAAADPGYMESLMEEGDLIVLSSREEMICRALECKAGCLVVCTVDDIEDRWKKKAQEIGCTVICVGKDTYTVSKLLEQSMPVSYFMSRHDLVTYQTGQLITGVREDMAKYRYRSYPVLDANSHYVGMITRRHLIGEQKRKVILVDHQETRQAVDGLENAEIMEVVDHHKIGDIQTLAPIYFRNQPLGCTATILTQMFDENGVEIPPVIAGLLLSAILSDTLMFKSPTCTKVDENAALRLAKIAGVDPYAHAMEMFKAGSNFEARNTNEILMQDFKKFQAGDYDYGVSQVNVMTEDDSAMLKDRISSYMEGHMDAFHLDMVFCMLTNVLEESTDLLYFGKDAERIVQDAFHKETADGSVELPHVLSRKKQLIPALMNAML